MKALLASALTALVLVTAAWASNVTPAQLASLSQRVAKLERANAALGRRVSAAEAQIVKTQAGLADQTITVDCLAKGWNAQKTIAYDVGSFQMTDGSSQSFFVWPTNGTPTQGYLITVADPTLGPIC